MAWCGVVCLWGRWQGQGQGQGAEGLAAEARGWVRWPGAAAGEPMCRAGVAPRCGSRPRRRRCAAPARRSPAPTQRWPQGQRAEARTEQAAGQPGAATPAPVLGPQSLRAALRQAAPGYARLASSGLPSRTTSSLPAARSAARRSATASCRKAARKGPAGAGCAAGRRHEAAMARACCGRWGVWEGGRRAAQPSSGHQPRSDAAARQQRGGPSCIAPGRTGAVVSLGALAVVPRVEAVHGQQAGALGLRAPEAGGSPPAVS